MEVRFVQRGGANVDDKLRDYMEKKISKLEKFFRKILNCQIVVTNTRAVSTLRLRQMPTGLFCVRRKMPGICVRRLTSR